MGLTDALSGLTLAASSGPKPPGRLGDDSMTIATEPRANQAMVEYMKLLGLDKPGAPYKTDCTDDELLEALHTEHVNFSTFTNSVPSQLDTDAQNPVTTETRTIKGAAGQDMTLHITRPKDTPTDALPCFMYIHGGGMVLIPTDNPMHAAWCRDLATGGAGAVVVMPDFRNAWDDEARGLRPFPAGLDDCVAAAEWVSSHKQELGIGADAKLLLCGESGGANLAIATALRLKREGKRDVVDGVYARCPYISGAYRWPREKRAAELPSLVECDGYFISVGAMTLLSRAYCRDEADYTDPLAWPYHATEEELRGSVPHTILVDELDPLRDEGVAFARKLERAGVRTVSRLSLGTIHAGPQMMRIALRDTRFADVADMHGFVERL